MSSILIPKDFQIPPLIAVLSCIWFTLVYVGLLYLSKKHRIGDGNPGLTNSHPQVIIHRIKATTISCIISCSSVWAVIYYNNGFVNHESPATEELVFRSCMISLLHYARISYVKIIFLTPLVFAIAHIHHAWENYVLYGRSIEAAKRAIFSSAFQFSYTTLFGWYATFIFMRTGNITINHIIYMSQ
ncbi:8135_t:CDS:2 [Cetraspora pellucida]|uniref:intramembrane prenyl-peptidase Rce1 n=1 Tax=Cetraspora pellucida TaxID=1433469 RepID=A0A9N9BFD3_9GLOM|nr:8135_t:CDS:2 [Cetraspora pellucida]